MCAYKPCKQKNSKVRLNFTINSFVFWCINCENRRRSFCVNLASKELSKMRTFCVNLASKQLPKWVWTSQQIILFLDTWIVKIGPEHFYKCCKQRTSTMCLNFTKRSLVLWSANRENAPKATFMKLKRQKLPKCVWTSQQTASFSRRINCENAPRTFFVNFASGNFKNASEPLSLLCILAATWERLVEMCPNLCKK